MEQRYLRPKIQSGCLPVFQRAFYASRRQAAFAPGAAGEAERVLQEKGVFMIETVKLCVRVTKCFIACSF